MSGDRVPYPSTRPTVDRATIAELDDDWFACLVVHPNGDDVWPWLFAPVDQDNSAEWVDGCCCPSCAPHEHPGRPIPYAMDIALATHRCGRPRLDGRPCRTVVGGRGDTCRHHRQASP